MAIKDMSRFQLIFTGIFAGFIVAGVLVFALYRSAGSGVQAVNLTVWGGYSEETFRELLSVNGLSASKTVSFNYVKKDSQNFENDFINALADGNPPDLVFLSQDEIQKESNKFFPIPYQNIDERTYKDTYVQEAEDFMRPNGIIALPLVVDPMVMFWNRNLFQDAALAAPPKFWDEFYDLVPLFTKQDGATHITQSAIAFGEYSNINNAKEILSTLMFQAGTPIISIKNGLIENDFSKKFNLDISPAEAAVSFFTQFSNPSKTSYSWNRSLPMSKTMFLSGDLAVYFAPASELFDIQDKNPNLNFDVTYMPQSRESKDKILYGSLSAIAVVKASHSVVAAAQMALKLSSKEGIDYLSKTTGLPPSRRDLLQTKQTNAANVIFYQSALWSRGWLDPDNQETNNIFSNMINSITSGRSRSSSAIEEAGAELDNLLQAQAKRDKN